LEGEDWNNVTINSDRDVQDIGYDIIDSIEFQMGDMEESIQRNEPKLNSLLKGINESLYSKKMEYDTREYSEYSLHGREKREPPLKDISIGDEVQIVEPGNLSHLNPGFRGIGIVTDISDFKSDGIFRYHIYDVRVTSIIGYKSYGYSVGETGYFRDFNLAKNNKFTEIQLEWIDRYQLGDPPDNRNDDQWYISAVGESRKTEYRNVIADLEDALHSYIKNSARDRGVNIDMQSSMDIVDSISPEIRNIIIRAVSEKFPLNY